MNRLQQGTRVETSMWSIKTRKVQNLYKIERDAGQRWSGRSECCRRRWGGCTQKRRCDKVVRRSWKSTLETELVTRQSVKERRERTSTRNWKEKVGELRNASKSWTGLRGAKQQSRLDIRWLKRCQISNEGERIIEKNDWGVITYRFQKCCVEKKWTEGKWMDLQKRRA